ncbi:TIGR01459 family HAD-type hydrolase [Nitratireductor basaltis]|uniref:HAD family hydrolase n=1 Tax=Nitratireductor basaltis TaxID=472175 RepID=A0A084UDA9_9HYPH|nr:TIGR01459 family HAD-type hydrolase [Nitratireductor basaltis]KFB10945.1 HAD family hydrolase [Nitratireductor basaltis]
MAENVKMIDRLEEIADPYKVILSDVWGVVHNGVSAFPDAVEALARMREAGKVVILITNAPRPHPLVIEQLGRLGVREDAWDRVITSGDVTRKLIEEGPRRIFHLGPERDTMLYDGLDVELVEEFEASGVVCTGLEDDENEGPEDYAEILQRLRARDLPFICANPDIVVERGDRLIYCAGALAREYGLLGGRTLIAGKPFAPIYEAAMQAAGEIAGTTFDRSEALAIGDGVLTDVKGGVNAGLDVLFVTAGIHGADYNVDGKPDTAKLGAFFEKHALHPVASIHRLR